MYRNVRDTTGNCAQSGTRAEDIFAELLRKEGYTITPSTRVEQFRHIDLHAEKNGQKFTFDVKARKKLLRENTEAQDDLIWVECLSVSGKIGWAFSSVNYIAFERENDFVVVPQKKLADFVAKKCNLKKIAYHPSQALYCKYERPGRKDCLTLIRGSDIVALSKKILPKNEKCQNK